jgi:hypothetical protein
MIFRSTGEPSTNVITKPNCISATRKPWRRSSEALFHRLAESVIFSLIELPSENRQAGHRSVSLLGHRYLRGVVLGLMLFLAGTAFCSTDSYDPNPYDDIPPIVTVEFNYVVPGQLSHAIIRTAFTSSSEHAFGYVERDHAFVADVAGARQELSPPVTISEVPESFSPLRR